MEEESNKLGVGVITPVFIERLSRTAEAEIYPISRFSETIGYLSLVGGDLYLAVCPTFSRLREESTFSLYKLLFDDFLNYCNSIKHTSKFGEVVYQFIHSRNIIPLMAGIPTLQEALALITTEVASPLQ